MCMDVNVRMRSLVSVRVFEGFCREASNEESTSEKSIFSIGVTNIVIGVRSA